MKRLVRSLLILAFLFGLFTTSFASWVCVGKPVNTKDYAIFQSSNVYKTVSCSFENDRYLCCADIPLSNEMRVTYTTVSNETIERVFHVLQKEVNGLSIVKVFTKYDAFITLSGREGNYLVKEEIPKENVETASDIVSDAMILSYDPTIAWFVSIKKNGHSTVSYYVKRGSIPSILPEVSLSDCKMKIKPLDHELLKKGDQFFLFYTFAVFFNGKKVIPPRVDVYVNDSYVSSVKIDPKGENLEIFTPVGSNPKEIDLKIKASVGSCGTTFAQTLHPEVESSISTGWLILLAAVVIVLGLLLWREAQRR